MELRPGHVGDDDATVGVHDFPTASLESLDQRSQPTTPEGIGESQAKSATRNVWRDPIIWREMCTSAYGRKVFVIKLAYLVAFVAAAALLPRQLRMN